MNRYLLYLCVFLNQLSCAHLVLPPTRTSVCWAFCVSLGVTPVAPRRTCSPPAPVPALCQLSGLLWAGGAPGICGGAFHPSVPTPGMLRALTCHPCSGWLQGPSWHLLTVWAGAGGSPQLGQVCHPCVTYLAVVPISVSASFLVHPPVTPCVQRRPSPSPCPLCCPGCGESHPGDEFGEEQQ